jgi:hypothetical protein
VFNDKHIVYQQPHEAYQIKQPTHQVAFLIPKKPPSLSNATFQFLKKCLPVLKCGGFFAGSASVNLTLDGTIPPV